MLSGHPIAVGQEVTLAGYPSEWLLVDRADGRRVRVRRAFGEQHAHSSGFWIDAELVRQTRNPAARPD